MKHFVIGQSEVDAFDMMVSVNDMSVALTRLKSLKMLRRQKYVDSVRFRDYGIACLGKAVELLLHLIRCQSRATDTAIEG